MRTEAAKIFLIRKVRFMDCFVVHEEAKASNCFPTSVVAPACTPGVVQETIHTFPSRLKVP